MIKKQEDLIKKVDWDVLIILDACRYDYLKRVYHKYLNGHLEKVLSPASHTSEWRGKIFTKEDFKEVVYISANPYINSKVPVDEFDARDKFAEIVDVWDFGWDRNLGTVPPEVVSQELEKAIETHSKKIIAHYLQPHAPYLNLGIGAFGGSIPEKGRSFDWIVGRSLSWIERKIFLPLTLLRWMYLLRLSLGIGAGAERETYARIGLRGLRENYKKNLRAVLISVSKLISKPSFKERNIVITSDHGELLGDSIPIFAGSKNRIGHVSESRNPILQEVPWLEVSD